MVTNGSKTGRKGQSIKTLYGQKRVKLFFPKCLVLVNYRLEIMRDESVTSINHYNEFYVNSLFDRSIYRPMCTNMGNGDDLLAKDKFFGLELMISVGC